MFTYRRRAQFAETDLAGIVHFSVMFLYMEEAEHAMWRAAGLSIADPRSEYAWPRLSASLEFRNPLRFEDEFDVRIEIAALKTRMIEYACTIVRGDVVIARGVMTAACARKQPDGTMKAAELPSDVVQRLKNVTR